MSKKIIGAIAAFALVLSLVGAQSASALTAGDIAMLQAAGIISAAQAASLSAGLTPSSVTAGAGYTFAKDLTIGSKGADVTALQQWLVSGGYLTMPAGVAYGYFGALTKAAVIKFQLAKGITPAAGYFGSKTRGVVNASGSTGIIGTTGGTTSGTDLLVTLAPTSPLASALVAGQAAADLAEFTFTNRSAAPAVVTNVTLQRMGVSADTALNNVYLYSGAVRLTDAASVSSGKITFNAASGIFTVPAGSSMTVSVRADIAGGTNGQLIAIALTGVTSSLSVSAIYPISGSSMSVFSSADIAQATSTLSGSVTGNTSITAGSLNQTIWSTSLSLSGRAVYLKSLALKVIGSIPQNSLQNVKLYVSGIQVGTSNGMDMNGMLTFDLSAMPYKMDSSRTIEVRADVVNGSSRTFSVQLQNPSDMQIIDSNYNVGITVGLAAGSSWSTGTFTISTGSVTVTSDPSLAAGNVVTGASNVALARYTFKAFGEDMKISYLLASSSQPLDNVSLYANGVQIGSTQTLSATNTAKSYSIGSSLIIPAGQTVTVEIRGDVKTNGVNLSTTNDTIKVALSGSVNNAQGSYSSQLSTVPSTAIQGPVMTVVGAGLTVAKNTASNINITSVPNVTGVKIGSYILQANSSEDVKVTNITVNLGGTIVATTSLSNLNIVVDGVAQTPINPQSSNNFSVNLLIPANTSKVVDVYTDISNVSGTATTSISINGYGTGSNVTITPVTVYGQTITVGAGTIATPTTANTSPTAQLVVGGTMSKIADFNFVATNGAGIISEMYFNTTGPVTSISVAGSPAVPVTNNGATSTGLSINIPVGYAGTNVPVTVTYSNVGQQSGVASAQAAQVTVAGFKYTSGNNTVTATSSVSSNVMTVVGSKPTISVSNPVQTIIGAGGTVVLARVTVSADAAGPVTLLALPIRVSATAGATVTHVGDATGTVAVGGNNQIGVHGGVATISDGSITGTTTFDNGGYQIAAGQTVTFDIYGTVVQTATTDSVQTSVIAPADFQWIDVNGNQVASGTAIYNYPTNAAVVSY